MLNGEEVKLFGSSLWLGAAPADDVSEVAVDGLAAPALVHAGGLLLRASDGRHVNVERLHVNGRMMPASRWVDFHGGRGSPAEVACSVAHPLLPASSPGTARRWRRRRPSR